MAFRLDESTFTSPNYTPHAAVPATFGRPRGTRRVTLHHWGIDGQTIGGISAYLCRTGGNTSAHYSLQDGLVYCLVSPWDAAWHSGSAEGNATSTGIECRPEMTAGDLATLVEFLRWYQANVADGDIELYAHQWWSSTACPGRYLGKIDWLVTQLNNGTPGAVSGSIDTDKRPAQPAPTDPLEEIMSWYPSKQAFEDRMYEKAKDAVINNVQNATWPGFNGRKQTVSVAVNWILKLISDRVDPAREIRQYGPYQGKDLGANKANVTTRDREAAYRASEDDKRANEAAEHARRLTVLEDGQREILALLKEGK